MSTLPATLEQRVKERISETISDLIPADEISSLVDAQVQHFRRNHLPGLIANAIREQFTAAIKAEFAKPEYALTWSQFAGNGASEAVRQMIEQSAGAILSNIIGGMVQQTLYQMQSNMPRY